MSGHEHHGGGGGSAIALPGSRTIALVGAPNAGKSSVFNLLTGLRAKTGNYPGVTVARSFGQLRGSKSLIEDLPGSYSLQPLSPDEQVVVDALAGEFGEAPDALLLVVDATTLRRSLSLVADTLRLGLPTALVLTMTDELAARGGAVDTAGLSRALGIPVHAVVAHRGLGSDELRASLDTFDTWERPALLPPTEPEAVASWSAGVLSLAGYRAAGIDERTRRIDRVLLHPVFGVLTFFAVMFGFFQLIFTVAAPAQEAIEN
ncbi:MAG TPA: FeoB small GTPase domain-containing protein, partial [Microbacteriaceae bacterium]|nr:FeoB small GTPase domain-containing protein [Microbacteriaceae bacterium]